jgi:hypothetical protein
MTEQDKSTKALAATCRVFISYSHDFPEHRQRVLALANQLRNEGVEAWIDQYVQDPVMAGSTGCVVRLNSPSESYWSLPKPISDGLRESTTPIDPNACL